jgi:hypothetical protein
MTPREVRVLRTRAGDVSLWEAVLPPAPHMVYIACQNLGSSYSIELSYPATVSFSSPLRGGLLEPVRVRDRHDTLVLVLHMLKKLVCRSITRSEFTRELDGSLAEQVGWDRQPGPHPWVSQVYVHTKDATNIQINRIVTFNLSRRLGQSICP